MNDMDNLIIKILSWGMPQKRFRDFLYHFVLGPNHVCVGDFGSSDPRDSDDYLAVGYYFGPYTLMVEIHKEFSEDNSLRYVSMEPYFMLLKSHKPYTSRRTIYTDGYTSSFTITERNLVSSTLFDSRS